ncbi:MAG: sigma 54-interacting transcriptional regulator [Myxococcales bacterium]|nr:sigma 54-interacting transcriptional regulator [Myxococcales bacterium]
MTDPKRPPMSLDDETERLAPAVELGEHWLVVIDAESSVAHRLPRGKPIIIGRAEDADVQIDHPSISRRHAQLLVGPPILIQDLRSANGVRINRQPLEPLSLTPVEPGQAIELGAVLAVVHRPSMLPPGAVRSRPRSADPERPSMLPGGPMLVRDPAMQDVLDMVRRVAPSELSVLLGGETGVGKEGVAELVHAGSRRADGPLLRVNCAALAESIAESELFGHEKGAFTGALTARAGIFEAADGGTVFLDEVGELSPALQAKLLRALETREVTRIGSSTPRRVDVRFVSATNRDLRAEIAAGRFREDLFFRLNGIQIEVPPLRERPKDILPLARRFARGALPHEGAPELTAATVAVLERYRWPGNVRELKNAMERAAVLAGDGPIEPRHLPREVRGELDAPSAEPEGATVRDQTVRDRTVHDQTVRDQTVRDRTVRDQTVRDQTVRDQIESLERQRIEDALRATGGNQTKAAALIGMPRRTFVKRLDAYGISRPRKGKGED